MHRPLCGRARARGRCFSAAANQASRFMTSPPNLRCSRPAHTKSGVECYIGPMFTTRSLYAHVSSNASPRPWNTYGDAIVKESLAQLSSPDRSRRVFVVGIVYVLDARYCSRYCSCFTLSPSRSSCYLLPGAGLCFPRNVLLFSIRGLSPTK
jgi:hypothetical protein